MSLAGFAIASAAGGTAQSFGPLTAARVQGIFAALLAPAALSLLTTTFTDPRERGKAFGIFGAIAGTGGGIGLLLGGEDGRLVALLNLSHARVRCRACSGYPRA
jgi:MFS family permease